MKCVANCACKKCAKEARLVGLLTLIALPFALLSFPFFWLYVAIKD